MSSFTINTIFWFVFFSNEETTLESGMSVMLYVIVISTIKDKYFLNMIMRMVFYHHRIIYSLNTLGCICLYKQLNDFKSLINIFFSISPAVAPPTRIQISFVRLKAILFIKIYKEFKRSLLITMHLRIKYNY